LIVIGHGGNVRRPYGTLFHPTDYGSAGCPGSKEGGKAGGVIFITVGDELYLDGLIESKGQNAAAHSNAGGGSGGSIWITTGRFNGHGVITVDGGTGNGVSSGGGSGGRLALLNRHTRNKYQGVYSSLGGEAGDPSKSQSLYSGGPGTVFIQDNRNGQFYSKLLVDNKNRPWDHYMTLNEKEMSFVFDEVSLMRKASLHMPPSNKEVNLTIHNIVGDRTGLIHIHTGQILMAEYKPTSYTITRLVSYACFRFDNCNASQY